MIKRTKFPILATLAWLSLPLTVSGCTGTIGGTGSSAGDPSADSPGPTDDPRGGPGEDPEAGIPDQPLACVPGNMGTARLLRLTRAQYDNTVRDLLGDKTTPALGFPQDDHEAGLAFWVNAGAGVSRSHVESFAGAAEKLAASAILNMKAILPCDPVAMGASACADKFIETFGRRAYRRPLTIAQRALAREKLFNAGETFNEGIGLVIQGLLQSPYFLYRVELGAPDQNMPGARKLTGHEIATRLSYFLWGSMPDVDLLAAADADQFSTPEGVAARAEQMLASPRARPAVVDMHRQWLGTEALATRTKDITVFPEFTPRMRDSMGTEFDNFVDYVVRSGDGKLSTLFGSAGSASAQPFTFADADLAKLYGVDLAANRIDLQPAPELPTGFVPVALDKATRAGALTMAGLFAAFPKPDASEPVGRGKLIRERFLCQEPPPPPPNVPELAKQTADLTPRQQLEAHRDNPACSGCHQMLEPLGFGLENYDGIGKFVTQDRFGRPVDSQGDLTGTDVDGPFQGGVELAGKLLASDLVQQCVAKQWFRYAMNRLDDGADRCALQNLALDLRSTGSIRELVLSVVRMDAFRYIQIN